MKDKTIFKENDYRIIEVLDTDTTLEDLKGDVYCPTVNSDILPEVLKIQEIAFERRYSEGEIYGYELQVWNSAIGIGWEHVDSCYGFLGHYDDTNKHYIVEDLKNLIGLSKEEMHQIVINYLSGYVDDAFKGAFTFYLEGQDISDSDIDKILEISNYFMLNYRGV